MDIHHPEHLEVAHLNNQTWCSAPRRVQRAQGRAFNNKKDSVEDLNPFVYLETVEIIANVESQPQPPTLPTTPTYPTTGPSLHDYIAGQWERNTHSCLETNLQCNPYCPLVTHEELQHIQCGIKKKGMKSYNDNKMMEENTAQHFERLKNMSGFQQLVASMHDTQVATE
jgi:hypothetical protein